MLSTFFLKQLRVEASRISTVVSFHNFRAEYLKPFFPCSVFSLGIWRSWQFLSSRVLQYANTGSFLESFNFFLRRIENEKRAEGSGRHLHRDGWAGRKKFQASWLHSLLYCKTPSQWNFCCWNFGGYKFPSHPVQRPWHLAPLSQSAFRKFPANEQGVVCQRVRLVQSWPSFRQRRPL